MEVNKTDRRQDYNNVVCGYIAANLPEFKNKRILDFGAGKLAIFARKLNSMGLTVDAYECGDNVTDYHVSDCTGYDLIYASNVINVQASEGDLRNVLGKLNYTDFICNYPSSPRKAGLTTKQIESILMSLWGVVKKKYIKGTPIFICTLPLTPL